jgi:hypothetical protein
LREALVVLPVLSHQLPVSPRIQQDRPANQQQHLPEPISSLQRGQDQEAIEIVHGQKYSGQYSITS